jgi:hypothetical protein
MCPFWQLLRPAWEYPFTNYPDIGSREWRRHELEAVRASRFNFYNFKGTGRRRSGAL